MAVENLLRRLLKRGHEPEIVDEETLLRRVRAGAFFPGAEGLSLDGVKKMLIAQEQAAFNKSITVGRKVLEIDTSSDKRKLKAHIEPEEVRRPFGRITIPPLSDTVLNRSLDILERARGKDYQVFGPHFWPGFEYKPGKDGKYPVWSERLDGWLRNAIADGRIEDYSVRSPAWVFFTSLLWRPTLTHGQIIEETCPVIAKDLGVQEDTMLPSPTEHNILSKLWPKQWGEDGLMEWLRGNFIYGDVDKNGRVKNGGEPRCLYAMSGGDAGSIFYHKPDFKSGDIRFRVMIVFPQSR